MAWDCPSPDRSWRRTAENNGVGPGCGNSADHGGPADEVVEGISKSFILAFFTRKNKLCNIMIILELKNEKIYYKV